MVSRKQILKEIDKVRFIKIPSAFDKKILKINDHL